MPTTLSKDEILDAIAGAAPIVWVFSQSSNLTSFMGAVQTHNAVHCPIFKQRWLNKVYQVVLTCTYGHPVSSLVPGHTLSHHKHTQSRKDVMRTTKAQFRWHLLNGLLFLFIVAPYTMKADAAYTKMMRTRHPRWFRQMMFELAGLIGPHLQ